MRREAALALGPALALALALAAGLPACRRPQPSPEYQEARERHAALIATHPLEAYGRPEMAGVLDLLDRVPRGSLDAEAAADLRRKIEGERGALAEEQSRRARLVAGAGAAPPDTVFATGGSGGGGGGGGEATAGARPAGDGGAGPGSAASGPAAQVGDAALPARAPSRLAAGTPLDDFEKAHGKCFAARAPARIAQREGKPIDGEAWALRDDPACRSAYPAEIDRLVLFADGKLLEVREAGEAKAVPTTGKVQGVQNADGSVSLAPGTRLPPGAALKWDKAPGAPAGAGKTPEKPR